MTAAICEFAFSRSLHENSQSGLWDIQVVLLLNLVTPELGILPAGRWTGQ